MSLSSVVVCPFDITLDTTRYFEYSSCGASIEIIRKIYQIYSMLLEIFDRRTRTDITRRGRLFGMCDRSRRSERGSGLTRREALTGVAVGASLPLVLGGIGETRTRARQRLDVETDENGYVGLSGDALRKVVPEPATVTVTSSLVEPEIVSVYSVDGRFKTRRTEDIPPATVELETDDGHEGFVEDTLVVVVEGEYAESELRRGIEIGSVEEKRSVEDRE